MDPDLDVDSSKLKYEQGVERLQQACGALAGDDLVAQLQGLPLEIRKNCCAALLRIIKYLPSEAIRDATYRKQMLLAALALQLDPTSYKAQYRIGKAAAKAIFHGKGTLPRYWLYAYSSFSDCAENASKAGDDELRDKAMNGMIGLEQDDFVSKKLNEIARDGEGEVLLKRGGNSPTKLISRVGPKSLDKLVSDKPAGGKVDDVPLKVALGNRDFTGYAESAAVDKMRDVVNSSSLDLNDTDIKHELNFILRGMLTHAPCFVRLGTWNLCAYSNFFGHGLPESLVDKMACLNNMAAAHQWSVIALQECPASLDYKASFSTAIASNTYLAGLTCAGLDQRIAAQGEVDVERHAFLYDPAQWELAAGPLAYPNPGKPGRDACVYKRRPLLIVLRSKSAPQYGLALVSVHLKSTGEKEDNEQNIRELTGLPAVAEWASRKAAEVAGLQAAVALAGDFNRIYSDASYGPLRLAGYGPSLESVPTNQWELMITAGQQYYDNVWVQSPHPGGWLSRPSTSVVSPLSSAEVAAIVKLIADIQTLGQNVIDASAMASGLASAAATHISAIATKKRSSDHKAVSFTAHFANGHPQPPPGEVAAAAAVGNARAAAGGGGGDGAAGGGAGAVPQLPQSPTTPAGVVKPSAASATAPTPTSLQHAPSAAAPTDSAARCLLTDFNKARPANHAASVARAASSEAAEEEEEGAAEGEGDDVDGSGEAAAESEAGAEGEEEEEEEKQDDGDDEGQEGDLEEGTGGDEE